MLKSEMKLYKVVQRLLMEARDKPQTCVDLFDNQTVRELVDSPAEVSNLLGNMWRKGLVQRWYAEKTLETRSRYAYTWLAQGEVLDETKPAPMVKHNKKLNVRILEDEDSIVLNFENFKITVTPRKA